jgi:DNA-binding HxlR family transcriptional regulator
LDLFQVLSLAGTRKVLEALAKRGKPTKYKQLVLAVGFSTTTSRCLKAMMANGIVTRRILDEPYRPVEYRLTMKGQKLAELATQIEELSKGPPQAFL